MMSYENNKYIRNDDFEYLLPSYGNSNDNMNRTQEVATSSERSPRRIAESNKSSKKKQTAFTMRWLDENYVITEGVCLPRCILYSHYLNFCQTYALEPSCAATFGKMIRQKFPGITTRRLGTRGHSKYHYYGIGIRESSKYYHAVYSSKGLTRFSTCSSGDQRKLDNFREFSPPIHAYLTNYPDMTKVVLAPSLGLDKGQVDDLLLRHKTYCQNIITSAVNLNLDQMQNHVTQFWEIVPPHCHSLLESELIVDVICLGESVLYKDLIDIFIPLLNEDVPDSALERIRYIAKNWEDWEITSLSQTTQTLANKLIPIARQFAQSVKRQSSFLHLAKSVQTILKDPEKIAGMVEDIARVDLGSIGSQAFFASAESEGQDAELNAELLNDLKELLQQHAPLEKYISWLDSIVEQKVIKPSKQNGRSTKKRAQDFLLKWSFFGARIMHNLTLNNAISSGSFHALRMLFDEYVLFGVETQFNNEKDQELMTTVEKHLRKQTRNQTLRNTSPVPSKKWCSNGIENNHCSSYEESFTPFTRSSVISQGPRRLSSFNDMPNFNPLPPQVCSPTRSEFNLSSPVIGNDVFRQSHNTYNHNSQYVASYHSSFTEIKQINRSSGTYVNDGDQIFASLENIPASDIFSCLPQQNLVPQNGGDFRNQGYCTSPASVSAQYQYVPVISMAGSAYKPSNDVENSISIPSEVCVSNGNEKQQMSSCHDNTSVPVEASANPQMRDLECCNNFPEVSQEQFFNAEECNFGIPKTCEYPVQNHASPPLSQCNFESIKPTQSNDESIFSNSGDFPLQSSDQLPGFQTFTEVTTTGLA